MWIPPQSTSNKSLEVNQYVGDKSLKKRAYVKIEEWEPHKDFVLRQRHAKVKEKDILLALRQKGFMVEMHQLKKVLQLWNSKRNLKRKQRDYIVQIVKERRRAGKNQTVFYHPSGTLIDLPEVKEIMRRYGNSEPLEPPSPGGLIPGSPRLRQTPPDILFSNREIPPNYSDHIHRNASPGSLGSMHSPIVGTELEYTTPPHLAIDLFLQQTTAQSSANVTVPTTLGYSPDILPGTIYPPLGFGDDLSMPSVYSDISRPMQASELDHSLEYRSERPTLPTISQSAMASGYIAGPSSSSFIQEADFAADLAPYQQLSEPYSYPPPVPAPPRRPIPGRYAPPAPPAPPQMQGAPPPTSAMPQAKSKSIFSRFGFSSSKKSSQPPMAAGGSIAPGAPLPVPYMQSGTPADQYLPPPQPAQLLPPPIAAPGIVPGAPMPAPSAERFRAPARSSARTPKKEPFIKEEFAEISTLDYSRDESKKPKESKNFGYSEMADRAGRLLSGMPPKEDESIRRARQRADEDEAMRRRAEEARLESQRLEQHRFYAQEQERLRAIEQARMRDEEEARHRQFERVYIQPDAMEVDEDAEWTEEEEETQDNWARKGSATIWKQEPQGEDEEEWGDEEEPESWQDSATSQRPIDFEYQRLQETLQRVSGRLNLYQPIMRIQREIVFSQKHTILARLDSKKLVFDVSDDFKIKLREIRNDDFDDVVSALGELSVSDKEKKNDDKDLANALEGLKVSDDKKESGEKWDDEEKEEEWSDEEEKEDDWGEDEKEDEWEDEEEETEDKWDDGKDDKVLAKFDNLTLSEKSPIVTEQKTSIAVTPMTAEEATEQLALAALSSDYIPFKKLLKIEFEHEEFYELEFASDDMEQIYRIHLRDWLQKKVEDAEWELGMAPQAPKKSNGKKFLDETDKRCLPTHIYKATKHLVKAKMDPDATEAEIQYETKLWNWVLQRYNTIISYMKENSDTYWTALWDKTEQAVVYFLPFLGKRFGTKHWFTLEGIKLLGESYIWEEIEGGWKYGLQLRNLAYDGFVSLGFENSGIVSDCVDDGILERERRKGRNKMELRRAVEHYRTIRADFGDWSQLGVYAIGLLIRALARVDKERAKKLIPTAAAGFLRIPRGMWWRLEVANSIWLVGEAMRELGMVKESVGFLWKTMPAMREIEGIMESLPATRVLGGIAEGFQALGKTTQAIQWKERVLEEFSEVLGRGHPETIFWAKRAREGIEARGIQLWKAPSPRTVEWVARRVFWEGQRRRVDQERLLKFTRKTIRKFESGSYSR
ncbi:hypothetical protein TWF506_004876 [Arthrobotrys conoides]|uniref:Clr5 domain-containing protein n=1 Tax=Arthrobotrys conoides TaxID=74498 RepID=A0AAN8RZB1_9PEZI